MSTGPDRSEEKAGAKRATRRAATQRGTAAWHPDWSVGLRLWLEHRGKAMLGRGRADLLAAIDRTRSISAAARSMQMSYRHAWLMVQAMNRAAGTPLVESAVGGVKGGGAVVTERGKEALATFQLLFNDVRVLAADRLRRVVRRDVPEQDVHVAASISLQDPLSEILSAYALVRPPVKVRAVYGAADELVRHIAAGAPCDVFLAGDRRPFQQLAESQLLADSAPRRLVGNGLAVVAPSASPLRPQSLKRIMREAFDCLAVAHPDCPLGRATTACLSELDDVAAIRRRSLTVDNSRAVLTAVLSGRASLGIAFSSDAYRTPGCRVLCRVAPRRRKVDYFAAVVGPESTEKTELMEFLSGAEAKACFARYGFEA